MVMKKGDKVREIGDTLTGTIVYIANGYAGKREVDLQLVPLDQLHKVSVGKGYARISNKTIIEEISYMIDADIDGLKVNATFDEKENMLIADLSLLVKDKG